MKVMYRSRRPEAGGAMTFIFEPTEPISWTAGQSIKLELPAGFASTERRFTIASAPYEKIIAITTRPSDSPFKRSLFALSPGTLVTAYGIEGSFIWGEDTAHRLFCASGIGITPYIALLRQRAHEGGRLDATLLYANRDDWFIFGDELTALAGHDPALSLRFSSGVRLSADLIVQAAAGHPGCLVYLSGPSAMIDEVSPFLISAGVDESRLRRDWFTGRPGWDEAAAGELAA